VRGVHRRSEGLRHIGVNRIHVGEGRIDERVGGGRTDTGPDNRQEVVSEIRE
jgi:hypothetical protein